MTKRLVDVFDGTGSVLHTYPITLGELGDAPDDAAYEAKALEAAANGRLVPDDELAHLTARIHVTRGGQMSSYGDDVQSNSETKLGLEQAVRERAYALWQEDGRPEDPVAHPADQHVTPVQITVGITPKNPRDQLGDEVGGFAPGLSEERQETDRVAEVVAEG